jgi:hypothetical protein
MHAKSLRQFHRENLFTLVAVSAIFALNGAPWFFIGLPLFALTRGVS